MPSLSGWAIQLSTCLTPLKPLLIFLVISPTPIQFNFLSSISVF
jgi:hypothetical protein